MTVLGLFCFVLIILPPFTLFTHEVSKRYYRLQSTRQQRLQAHSVEIEATDGGGYRVVE